MLLENKIRYGKRVSLIYLINPNLKRLLFYLRDNKNIPEKNKWSIFGGVLKNKESKKDGLKRELKEEINIPIYNITYLGSMINNKNQELYFFKGKVYEDNLDNIRIREGQMISYFLPHEIKGKKFEPSVENFYKKNKNEILK